MLVARFSTEGGFNINEKAARGRHKWMIKIVFTAALESGDQVRETDTIRTKERCELRDTIPLAEQAVAGMLDGLDDVVSSEGCYSVWRL